MERKKILIVDDEPAIARALTVRLRAAGYEVSHAVSGQSGLDAAAQAGPDVILLDISMPDMDGFEVHRRLKADPGLARVPVIFLSGNVPARLKSEGFDVSGSFYLTKPYEFEDVLRAIELVTRRPALAS